MSRFAESEQKDSDTHTQTNFKAFQQIANREISDLILQFVDEKANWNEREKNSPDVEHNTTQTKRVSNLSETKRALAPLIIISFPQCKRASETQRERERAREFSLERLWLGQKEEDKNNITQAQKRSNNNTRQKSRGEEKSKVIENSTLFGRSGI